MKDGLLDQLARLQQQNAEIIKTIQAICRVVGTAEVQAEVYAGAREEMAVAISNAVKDGKLEAGEILGDESVLVGQEADKSGQLLPPGRFQLFLRDLAPEVRKLFLGKKVGDKVETPSGNSITVTEVYDTPVENAAPAKKSRKVRAVKTAAVNAAVPYDPED